MHADAHILSNLNWYPFLTIFSAHWYITVFPAYFRICGIAPWFSYPVWVTAEILSLRGRVINKLIV